MPTDVSTTPRQPGRAGEATTRPTAEEIEAVRAIARLARLLERASAELNIAHYRVLAAVASGDARASRVAARLAVGKPTVSAAVDALCQRGLLVRADSLGDQRVVALELTPAGEATLGRVEAAMAAQLTAVCGRLTDGDVVIRTFAALGDELDERRAGRSQ